MTYFRSMGGSFGTTLFGAIFSNRLAAVDRGQTFGHPADAGSAAA